MTLDGMNLGQMVQLNRIKPSRTISALVVVEDGQASSSSSCLDLASQAPSAKVSVFMKQCT